MDALKKPTAGGAIIKRPKIIQDTIVLQRAGELHTGALQPMQAVQKHTAKPTTGPTGTVLNATVPAALNVLQPPFRQMPGPIMVSQNYLQNLILVRWEAELKRCEAGRQAQLLERA